MGILGEIAYHDKDYAKARSVEEKVLSICTRVLGEKNHFTLQAKDDLAITLAKEGEYTKAADMHEQVRKIRLETLGSLHPATLEIERMLARAWRMAGRLESARGLNEDILSRANRAFGHDHWDTGRAANALWRCLVMQRLVEEAGELQKKYGLVLNVSEQEMLREAEGYLARGSRFGGLDCTS